MKSVITGDIINSQSIQPEVWFNALKDVLGKKNPKVWEIYRGDEFQILVPKAENALLKALQIKAKIKTIKGLDVRLSIGLGTQEFKTDQISQSSGTAFVNSGRNLERIKESKINLAIQSQYGDFDRGFNLILKWLLLTADNWTVVSAEIALMILKNPKISQEEIAKMFGITQSSVSQRIKRANLDLILETDQYFRKKIAELK
ncbi:MULTISPECIES: SatD family protein [Chryseobacterium]|uniref:SatD family protein n=1 Tax=Chryseobacterium sp. R2A-55 TaxID=2744445 RepID=UPI001F1859EF|nr:SatD family protein [Chryseobacterium sp. R2A-55]